jgi:thioredoxin 1
MKKFIIIFALFATSLFAYEHLTVDDMAEKVKDKKVIVDFYATWCPPCKIIAKNLDAYNDTKPDDVIIYKVDIDQQRELVDKYGVVSIPTILYMKDGKITKSVVGIQSVDEINNNVNSYLLK